ncbi:hypothetical protein [Lichenifustis flavocetrariae]|uniref:Lipoprotein n=1 Tax=Lichenifustis flavocetrariae TaxID=2949735 RepID=A0AA42CRI3_9HYPH|nr:hypothetical protein [Lichenifustis flavocetrariae]MCW6512527.1 hypothetical protein [Lichenifustis flavocetrariae]
MRRSVFFIPVVFGLAACAPVAPRSVAAVDMPVHEPLYTPNRVVPGRLEYAPDRTTFAPILTERFPYPTQAEANDAYRRLVAGTTPTRYVPASVWLFGCKPGALDAQTARVARVRGPVVHCATDFLDGNGRPFDRAAVNFAYDGAVWVMQAVDPPRSPVPWRNREGSPKDPWSWVPGRDRYE